MLKQFLKKSPLLLCAGAIFTFSSCSGEEASTSDKEKATTESTEGTQRSAPKVNSSGDIIKAEDKGVKDANLQESPQKQSIQVAPENSAEVKLNPPHGQPGHDCAVKVGDPLPNANNGAAIQMQQPAANSGVKLNPPHGQPGHDCAVKVGDPLN